MNVMPSGAKHLTVGMRRLPATSLKINEAKMIESSLEVSPPMRGPSLRSG